MKKLLTALLFLSYTLTNAQIIGKVTDKNNQPLPYVSIYLENSLAGTTTNDAGLYELPFKKTGNHVVVFQFLGFKTIKKQVEITSFPFELNVQMIEEQELLNEVNVSSKENPANAIIRNVIANKEKNTNKSGKYTADFYSRGLFKIKNAPKKILGQEVGDLGGGLDSTRSGIIYLSETVSKITYQKKPKNFKEVIVASKVSGEDNGISFNRAAEVNFNLYKNQVPVANANLFSPISDYAFSYYRFKLEGSFYDKNNKLVNKIKLIPKRENDRVFGGYIYIVEDDWAVYGAELTATGAQINNPIINLLNIKQNYNYEASTGIWALILQTINFDFGLFGFNVNGRFSASYANYDFNPNYTENTFGKEILYFEEGATKKDSVYWNKLRTVPLTLEEKQDYKIKDSIGIVKKSKKYLDSVDTKNNKFKLLSPILGYSYNNSYEKWRINYDGLLENINFNTVQGFNTTAKIGFSKRINDKGNSYQISSNFNYGFSDKRLRPSIYFNKTWNNFDRPVLNFSGGVTVNQFDDRNPISNFYNSLYSLIGKRNYAKYYEKAFAKVDFSKEISTGFRLYTSLEYTNRKPLSNTTDYSFFNRDRTYESNNPIDPNSITPVFDEHSLFKTQIAAVINPGSKYISYPDSKYTVRNRKFPTVTLGYRKTFGSGSSELHSDMVFSRLNQNFYLGNFGAFSYNARGGMFFNQKDIPFMDYYHPLANEIDLAPKDRLNSFYLLPYYQLSTNDKYAELHTEHNFEGFLLGKIPLINKLDFHTVIGYKNYFSAGRKPYNEYSVGLTNIGWGKWRFLRVDYVQSNYNGNKQNQFLFGISILD
ncbi:DUF5686 and carboxypeptidase regulatory-like domain-containing protein [Tenacibaculum sp. IB213877]|uniref:DUF5686 and carboxypeptidase regulatory-like domain-containing protein n=1 Tax=Tenacibaculum sp. IB213877 TaxID=3097351 RepID=UPI002A5988AF|nr:DUF5686 and carboxypeptidase regulatory-like domain-containing protein [Tenacibaculum sp. IB213877]MDY0781305.1 DUF5686 and carboxypeptidase regulatory-like domain-containing protein [Tenacibaculum sp. IB213877]